MSEANGKAKTKAATGDISSASDAKKTKEAATEATSKFCWNWAAIVPRELHDNPNFPFKPKDQILQKLVKLPNGTCGAADEGQGRIGAASSLFCW